MEWKKSTLVAFLVLFLVPTFAGFVHAQSPVESASIEEILEPLNKVYDLTRSAVGVIGCIALVVAGAMYLFSGNNIQSRENAKNMMTYSVIGLMVVYTAPMLVGYMLMA